MQTMFDHSSDEIGSILAVIKVLKTDDFSLFPCLILIVHPLPLLNISFFGSLLNDKQFHCGRAQWPAPTGDNYKFRFE